MTPEDRKVFDAAREMFLTDGWKNFIKDIEANIASVRVETIENEKAFWQAKGILQVLHQVAGYENFLYHQEQQAEEDDES